MKVTKAVFPVAGLGTRFLPATKASPKEMLTVVDKPLIQYAVEEAIEAGIKDLIFVTSTHKRAIEDHFDKNFELEYNLEQKNKLEMLEMVQNILPPDVNCAYVRQKEALGLGHAVLCAKPLVGNEPFAVLLADDLISNSDSGALSQMMKQYYYQKCGVIAVQEVPKKDTGSYGIVKTRADKSIEAIVEKPAPEKAPSTQAVVGRYILTPEIFSLLEQVGKGAGGEIQLTDAIARLIDSQRLIAYPFQGKRYDCGDKLGFLIANFELACKDKALGQSFAEYVSKAMSKQSQSN
ncbi:UTP--glucose-1-phosphate uridylyltransferase GalU [Fangia hongkongensis]|uniref:UTP--glucose-1-phosphate uridylyltransferase GalU n=1 Tax=Fangia hongkongensis TaxID=270495 RepID=UPI000376E7AE|nr:UTP--glucose-1-phosphate uridylyltransferase GalU [Fangia hongkongensis]MBK2123693.1 UTP--glucose-1-phosphate uridylyltransferase GalU [Fangia hongkongensis]